MVLQHARPIEIPKSKKGHDLATDDEKQKPQLGQWTKGVSVDDVVGGLVKVCTVASTPGARAAAATCLANLMSADRSDPSFSGSQGDAKRAACAAMIGSSP